MLPPTQEITFSQGYFILILGKLEIALSLKEKMKYAVALILGLSLFASCSEADLGTQIGNAYCACTKTHSDMAKRNTCLVEVSEKYKAQQEALSEDEKKAVQSKVEEITAGCAE